MKKTKEPIVPVNDQAEILVQDAASYRRLLELKKEQAEVIETLRQRLATRGRRKGRLAEDFFTEFFAKNAL